VRIKLWERFENLLIDYKTNWFKIFNEFETSSVNYRIFKDDKYVIEYYFCGGYYRYTVYEMVNCQKKKWYGKIYWELEKREIILFKTDNEEIAPGISNDYIGVVFKDLTKRFEKFIDNYMKKRTKEEKIVDNIIGDLKNPFEECYLPD
jgi:hypothetical protein